MHTLLGRCLHGKHGKGPFNRPCPSDTAKSVHAAPMTLEMYNLAKVAHVLCMVSRGKDCIWMCKKTGVLRGQQARTTKQEEQTLFQNSGLIRGACADPGMLAGLTCGQLSKSGTNSKLLCSGWSL